LFSALSPDLALTDPDINYEEIFLLVPLSGFERTTPPLASAPAVPEVAAEVESEFSRKFGDEVIQ
jgi:hypothetical protein